MRLSVLAMQKMRFTIMYFQTFLHRFFAFNRKTNLKTISHELHVMVSLFFIKMETFLISTLLPFYWIKRQKTTSKWLDALVVVLKCSVSCFETEMSHSWRLLDKNIQKHFEEYSKALTSSNVLQIKRKIFGRALNVDTFWTPDRAFITQKKR